MAQTDVPSATATTTKGKTIPKYLLVSLDELRSLGATDEDLEYFLARSLYRELSAQRLAAMYPKTIEKLSRM